MMSAVTNHLWQSTVFTLVVTILTLAMRNNGAHTRYRLWLAASMKFLIPFSILAAAALPLGHHRAAAIMSPTVSAVAHHVAQPFSFDPSVPSTLMTPSVSAPAAGQRCSKCGEPYIHSNRNAGSGKSCAVPP